MDRIRPGQQAFNLLMATDPALAEAIRGTEFDPFYDDRRIESFLGRIGYLRSRGREAK